MGLFDKIKEHTFLKKDNETENQLAVLSLLSKKTFGDIYVQNYKLFY